MNAMAKKMESDVSAMNVVALEALLLETSKIAVAGQARRRIVEDRRSAAREERRATPHGDALGVLAARIRALDRLPHGGPAGAMKRFDSMRKHREASPGQCQGERLSGTER